MTSHAPSPQEMPGHKGPWYHGTTLNAAAEIVRSGFSLHCFGIPNTAPKGAVYFTASLRRAMMWAEVHTFGQPVVIQCSLHPRTSIADAGRIDYTLTNTLVERFSWKILNCRSRIAFTNRRQLTGPELVALYAYAIHTTLPSMRYKSPPRMQRRWLRRALCSYGYQAIYRDFMNRMNIERAPDNELMVFDPQLIQVDAVHGLLQADGSRIPDLQGDHLIDASPSWQLGTAYDLDFLTHERWPDGPEKTLQAIVHMLYHEPRDFTRHQDMHEGILRQIQELLQHIPCTSRRIQEAIALMWFGIFAAYADFSLQLEDIREYIQLAAKYIPYDWRKALAHYLRKRIGGIGARGTSTEPAQLRRVICEIWLSDETRAADTGTGP